MNRRCFLHTSLSVAGTAALGAISTRGADLSPRRWKAALIGHTGRGDYGHEHDLIFNDRPNIDVVAVADPDPTGRAKAAQRSHATRTYDDYRQMLEKERPQLVCIAPRWTDQHHAMAKAALQIGAHLYLEKPFTQTLAEADDLLTLAAQNRLKIVVAHQMRLAPSTQHLKKALASGVIGDLLQINAHGKQDRRAGGEDMMVLGTHLFDLIRYLAGDATMCTARILQDGHEVTLADVKAPTENIGPVIGDEIEAQFSFPGGVQVNYTSREKNRATAGPWGMDLRGSKGVIRILTEIFPQTFLLKPGSWSPQGKSDQWLPLPDDASALLPASERAFAQGNRRLVDDWLRAIAEDQQPVCSGHEAMKALEMIMAVFQAGLTKARVALPMENRRHPLATA